MTLYNAIGTNVIFLLPI